MTKKLKTSRKRPTVKARRPKMTLRKFRKFDLQKLLEKWVGRDFLKFKFFRVKKSTPAKLRLTAGLFTGCLVLVVGWGLFKAVQQGPDTGFRSSRNPTSFTAPANGPLAKQFSFASHVSFAERVAFWSTYFWSKQQTSELRQTVGKGPELADSAPLVPKKFDCTTFVETVAALARSRTPGEFYPNLISIRYRNATPGYVTRNHFPELDWIPNNQDSGILRDITAQLAASVGLQAKVEEKEIDRGTWVAQMAKKEGRAIASTEDYPWNRVRKAKVTYIPIKDMEKIYDRIPSGAVLNVVRADSSAHPTLITHQGFVVREQDVVFIHHAYPTGMVRRFPLKQYVKKHMQDNETSNYPVIGFNFNQLTDSE